MSAQLIAALGNALFIGAVFTISVRLLMLWRRTREWPELLISSGLLILSLVGFPMFMISGLAGETLTGVNLPVLAIGLAALSISLVLVQAFTWRVFRPGTGWAAGVVVATGAAITLTSVLFFNAIAQAPDSASPHSVHGPYSLAVRLLFETWYIWMGVESLLEWVRARRRMAIGLSDPVVTNRFLLWGSMGVLLGLNGGVAMLLEARGMSPMTDALPAIWLGLNGAIAGTLMFMTFVPPKPYVRWLRLRYQERLLG